MYRIEKAEPDSDTSPFENFAYGSEGEPQLWVITDIEGGISGKRYEKNVAAEIASAMNTAYEHGFITAHNDSAGHGRKAFTAMLALMRDGRYDEVKQTLASSLMLDNDGLGEYLSQDLYGNDEKKGTNQHG